MITKLEIDRKYWLNYDTHDPEEGYNPYLRDDDIAFNNMCCLGFLCKAVGFTDDQINYIGTPKQMLNDLKSDEFDNPFGEFMIFNEEANSRDHWNNGEFFEDAIEINDSIHHDLSQREAHLKILFEKNGIELTFTGKYLK